MRPFRRPLFRYMRFALALLLLLVLGYPAVAQDDAGLLTIRLGETTERLAAGTDSTLHYALYLPSGYAPERPAPVLVLMDPRGRALTPLALFRDAAERLGYVVMSSYDTLSDADSAFQVNGRALDGLVQDAQLRFAADPARVYLVGFSGTAHFSWVVAPALDGHLAGFVGVGDGFLPDDPAVETALDMERPPAYFGIAGTRDFNYDNAWRRHQGLADSPLPHRFAAFEGPHAWPPKDLAEAALEWLELHAVRTGLATRPAVWVSKRYTAHLAEARRLEQTGRLADAVQRYEEIAQDFSGLLPVEAIQTHIDLLSQDPEVERVQKQRRRLAARVDEYKGELYSFITAYREADPLMPHHRALRLLDIPHLLRETEDEDAAVAAAAYRMLASASAQLGFYEPRDYIEAGDYDRAAGALRLAREIRPEAGHVCYRLAQAEAQRGEIDAALDALACAVTWRGVRPETLQTDPLLDPVRAEPRFAEITARYVQSTGVPGR